MIVYYVLVTESQVVDSKIFMLDRKTWNHITLQTNDYHY